MLDEVEEELRWCVCLSLRRVSGGLTGRCRELCLSCLRVTGRDGVKGADEGSCCLRDTAAGCGLEEEEAAGVFEGVEEHSCFLVTKGEGEEEAEEAWRPFTSALTLLLVLLFGVVLLRTASASLFTARLSSLGMIFARYAEDFLCTTVT